MGQRRISFWTYTNDLKIATEERTGFGTRTIPEFQLNIS